MVELQSTDAAVRQEERTPYLGEIMLTPNFLVNILRQSTQGGLCVTDLHIATATLKAGVLLGGPKTMAV